MLVQDENLKSLTVTDNLERTYPQDMSNPQNDRQLGQHSQVRNNIMADRMSKLKRDMGYFERGMLRIRTMLAKLKQDPTDLTSRKGSRPKKIITSKITISIESRIGIKRFTTILCT